MENNPDTCGGFTPAGAEPLPYTCPAEQQPLTVKEMSVDDRPRERALRYGISSLSTADLFAIILRVGTPGYPVTQLCRDMMRMNDGLLLNLERKTHEQLKMFKGVGESKALQIEAVMEIVRRYGNEKVGERPQIKSSTDIFNLMRHRIGNLPHEEMWVILLNNSNHVIGLQKVGEGGGTTVVADIKKMMKVAIVSYTQSIVICHNHPSGILIPSPQDDNITRKMKTACSACEMSLIDHVIVTSGGYYSYRDRTSLLS